VATYESLNFLVDVLDFEDLILEFLDHLFLSLGALFSHVGNLAEFLLLGLVFRVEFGVVLSELAEGLAGCSLDLETFYSLQHV